MARCCWAKASGRISGPGPERSFRLSPGPPFASPARAASQPACYGTAGTAVPLFVCSGLLLSCPLLMFIPVLRRLRLRAGAAGILGALGPSKIIGDPFLLVLQRCLRCLCRQNKRAKEGNPSLLSSPLPLSPAGPGQPSFQRLPVEVP